MRTRLAITGMGAITPIGLNVAEYWRNLVAGVNGIGLIKRFDAGRLPTRIAAEVKNFDDAWSVPKSMARSSSLFMRYAMAAAEQALAQAKMQPDNNNVATGICMATALGGADELCNAGSDYSASKSGKISPHLVPKAINNMASAHLAIKWGFHGPGFTITTACSAGGDALMVAAMLILTGQASSMLVMAGESAITPAIISSLSQAKALSRRNEEPWAASRPFDLNRDGFIVGEGGGAIFIETEASAEERGVPILALLSGWANTLDAYHITAPYPDGRWASLCMRKALDCAGMQPGDIDYINAHGTATRLGDQAETSAIINVFGPVSKAPAVSSIKGATGHLMGAGGLTEVIACVQSVRENIIPPTLNLEEPDPLCNLDYVPLKARKKEIRAAMSNAMGFGGQNSSIIISRYEKRR